jgi:opacity protein-like surface antigen
LTDSPHRFNTVRRMSDFRLTVGPQSRVRLRLGYSRNISEGPSYSTIHEGTETVLFQQWKTTVNAYQFGIDFHILPRTSFSYDQFLNYYKGDTSWVDQNFNFILSSGVPADLGIVLNTAAGQPCAAPVSSGSTTPPTAFAGCNGFLSYSRSGASRTSTPTEQISFESSYFRNLNMAGRVSYSSADNDVLGFNESSNLNVSRSRQRALFSSGVIGSRRLSVTADWAATYSITPKLRLVDEFRFANFRVPTAFDFALSSQFAQAPLLTGSTPSMLLPPAQFTAATCPSPFTASTCPQHSTSSGADSAAGTDYRFLGQDAKYNTLRVEYDFTRRFGGRLGYRYGHRNIFDFAATIYDREVYYPGSGAALALRGDCTLVSGVLPAQCTALADGSVVFSGVKAGSATQRDEFLVNEQSALVGLWARPTDQLRISFDGEFFYADRSFTRISPRHLQHYRVRASYRPRPWMTLGTLLNIRENRNNDPQIGNLQHNRSYGFNVGLEPAERLSFDLGYEHGDIVSNSNICFALGTGVATSTSPCPIISGTSPALGISQYTNKTHFGYFNLMWKPIPRLTTTLGYSIDSTTGNAPIIDPATGLAVTLNPNAPAGPLQYNYHRPSAGLAFSLTKGLTWKTGWSYYNYNEKALPDPTGSHDFHANLVDLALRYAF